MRMPLVPTQVASCSTLLHTALRSPFRAVLVYFFSFGWNRLTGSPQGWPKKPRSVYVIDGTIWHNQIKRDPKREREKGG